MPEAGFFLVNVNVVFNDRTYLLRDGMEIRLVQFKSDVSDADSTGFLKSKVLDNFQVHKFTKGGSLVEWSLEKHTMSKIKQVLVWTIGYNPWVMGGDVYRPIGCLMDVSEVFDLGRGFKGYVFKSPVKKIPIVVEKVSGAIIGRTLAQVRKDIKTASSLKAMKQQVKDAKGKVLKVKVLTQTEFWDRYERSIK